MSRRDTDPNRGNRKIPLTTVSAADLLGLNDDTAPAEDPRGGQATQAILCGPPKGCTCPAVAWYCICDASTTSPAAGRGDTDSGGEVLGVGCGTYPWQPLSDAARPAGDRAQPTQEVREAMERAIHAGVVRQWHGSMREDVALTDPRPIVRDLLALPEVAALLDAQAAVNRVEAVMARCNEARRKAAAVHDPQTALAYDDAGEWIRRALDGTAS